jgi:hypothetical protein
MRKLLLATAALVALALPSQAAIIGNLGANPTSATGNFENAPNTGAFDDQILFQLIGGPQFLTIASVTNTYAQPSDFIAGFNGSVVNFGADNMFMTADDFTVIGPVFATACPLTPNCQGFSGGAILNAGLYYLDIAGINPGTGGYAGNLSTAAVPVPGPLAGAGIPGILAAFGMAGAWWKRRKVAAAA